MQKVKKQDHYEVGSVMTLRLQEKIDHKEAILAINKLEGILGVEEIA